MKSETLKFLAEIYSLSQCYCCEMKYMYFRHVKHPEGLEKETVVAKTEKVSQLSTKSRMSC